MMVSLKENRLLKAVAFILSMILPCAIVALLFFWIELPIHPYRLVWCGFYGALLAWLSFRSKWLAAIVTLCNVAPFCFLAFGTLMGGIWGPFWLLLGAVFPFVL